MTANTSNPYSGFDHLPDELVREILVSNFNIYSSNFSIPCQFNFPKKIGLVCRRWRAVIDRNPVFWRVLYLYNLRVNNIQEFYQRIQRSGGGSLVVYIELGKSMDFPKTGHQIPLDDLQISRWRFIHIQLISYPCTNQVQIYREIFSCALPQFSELSLTLSEFLAIQDAPVHLLHAPIAISPRSLTISNCNVDWKDVTLEGLEHLKIQDLMGKEGLYDGLISFIKRSPNLQSLQLRSEHPGFRWRSFEEHEFHELLSSNELYLPKLTVLELKELAEWNAVLLLSIINAPILKTLELDVYEESDKVGWSRPEQPMIHFPSLQMLKLGNMEMDSICRSSLLTQLLSSTTSIRHIILDGGFDPFTTRYDYSPSLGEVLLTLQNSCFREMWAGVKSITTRKCSPRTLYQLSQVAQLPSLKLLHVSDLDLEMPGSRPRRNVTYHFSERVEEDAEKLKALPGFKMWVDWYWVDWYF